MSKDNKKNTKKNIKKNTGKNTVNNTDKKSLLLGILFILTPAILSFVTMAVMWIVTGNVALPGIKWNDEAAYIKLIETYSRHFSPVGYWGFNGNHALLGTGSAWSAAILLPYIIPAIVLPVGYSFVYICNIVYISGANVAFLFLVKPDDKKKIKLILAEVTSIVFILYLNTNMSEMFRYALAILIAGFLYKMFFDKCPAWIKYAVAPLTILYSVQVYTFFAFAIPIYVFALLKDKKLWVRIFVAVVSMGFISFISYGILHLISSNYNIGKTEALLAYVESGQIFKAIKSFFRMIYDGLVGLFNLRLYIRTNGVYIFHVMIMLLIIVSSAMTFFSKTSEKKDKTLSLISIYSICIFVFMYMTLYTIVPDTFLRGTEIPVIFSIYLLMLTSDRYFAWTIIFCNLTGMVFLPVNLKNFAKEERYYSREEIREWKQLEKEIAETIRIKESDNPWDNAILMYTMEPKAILAMPKGMGQNYAMDSDFYSSDAGYIFIPKFSHYRADWLESDYSHLMIGHDTNVEYYYDTVYDANGYVLFRKKYLADQ
ncbi:MAG: hypothetical protein J6X45_01405 [Lachnospiraceae bacterium]|nr:hypothetical protein [Lachnospiraceae bacterium]